MKWLYFVLILVFAAAPGWAEQKLDVNIPAGGAQDMLNMTTIPSSISDHSHDPTIIRSCTNAYGRVIYEGEDGYRPCIAATEGLKRGQKAKPTQDGGSHVIRIQEAN